MALPALLVLAAGFPLMGSAFRNASVVFLLFGAGLLAKSGQPPSVWLRASSSMSSIVAIIGVMQTFGIPIRLGEYDAAIRSWMDRRFKGSGSLFVFTTVVTNILTSFLNLGSISVLVSLFEDALRRRISRYERFFCSAMSRGYVLSALWAPGAVNLYLVAQVTGVPWSSIFLPGFVLSLLGIGLSILMELGGNGLLARKSLDSDAATIAKGIAATGEDDAAKTDEPTVSRASHILIVTIAFVVAVVSLERLGIGTTTNRIVLAGACIALSWTLSLSRRTGLPGLLKAYWDEGIMKAGDVGPFFVAMGVFSAGLENSGLLEAAAPAIQAGSGVLGAGSIVVIGAMIIALSIIGFHPFITIVLFGKMLSNVDLPITQLTLALSLSAGASAAYMISPFAGVIMTISKLVGARTSDVAVRWNWKYSVSFFAMGMLFAFGWGACFG
ncbi:MAG: hypothetical protein CVV47_14815 [Spirochaetae bacterium HGW-Spirochaetae-3]|jgi:hypothetical protein|nr:MAG: hypothetical protein CVV47_14815 [Spirochaetae bacterium HGW-Spirochaetae-3]